MEEQETWISSLLPQEEIIEGLGNEFTVFLAVITIIALFLAEYAISNRIWTKLMEPERGSNFSGLDELFSQELIQSYMKKIKDERIPREIYSNDILNCNLCKRR